MAQSKRQKARRRKEADGGKDATVFFITQRPLPIETAIRSGDHPTRPVRTEEPKRDERSAFSFLSLPKIWDIFAS